MRNLVRRYVTVEQRKAENEGVTEDDVNEIKQDISAFRCELIEILKQSGMNTSTAAGGASGKIIVLIFPFSYNNITLIKHTLYINLFLLILHNNNYLI